MYYLVWNKVIFIAEFAKWEILQCIIGIWEELNYIFCFNATVTRIQFAEPCNIFDIVFVPIGKINFIWTCPAFWKKVNVARDHNDKIEA